MLNTVPPPGGAPVKPELYPNTVGIANGTVFYDSVIVGNILNSLSLAPPLSTPHSHWLDPPAPCNVTQCPSPTIVSVALYLSG